MKVALGADTYGFPLKETIKRHLLAGDFDIEDFGVAYAKQSTPYYEIADHVANGIIQGHYERGILICGTGMGMAIIANKHPGIYAAACESPVAAEKSRSINNANVLTLGAMLTSGETAKKIVDVWFDTEFTEGWDQDVQAWLRNSLNDIAGLEQRQFKEKKG